MRRARPKCITSPTLNTVFCFSGLFSPSEMFMNRCVVEAMVTFRNPSMAMAPPTRLKTPKSDFPNAFRTMRVVRKATNMVTTIFMYKKNVFLINLSEVPIYVSSCCQICSIISNHFIHPYAPLQLAVIGNALATLLVGVGNHMLGHLSAPV